MSSTIKELKQLYTENKDYLKSIGLDNLFIKRCLKTKISTPEKIIKAIKTQLKKHNQFNKVSEEILNEFNNIDNTFNENEILNELKETETELEINDVETQIKTFQPNENTLEIYFKRGSKTLFKDIKQIISDKVNEFKGVKGVYLQMFYKLGANVL